MKKILLSLVLLILLVSCASFYKPDQMEVIKQITVSESDEFYLVVDDEYLDINALRKMASKSFQIGTGGQPLLPFEVYSGVVYGCLKEKLLSQADLAADSIVRNISEIHPSGNGNCYYISYSYAGPGINKDSNGVNDISYRNTFNTNSITNRLNSNLTARNAVGFFRIEVHNFNTNELIGFAEVNSKMLDSTGGVAIISRNLLKAIKTSE